MSAVLLLSVVVVAAASPAAARPPVGDAAPGPVHASNPAVAAAADPALAEDPAPAAGSASSADPVADPAAPEARAWLFMPAIELGVLWHADPQVAPGPVFRTSLDYRFKRINAPFLRLVYDATTARMTSGPSGAPRLVANLALHDVLVGGGARYGGRVVQGVASALIGAQIAEVPVLRADPDATLLVDTETRFGGVATVGAGIEVYFSEDAALTFDLSGRAAFSPLRPGASPLAGAFMVGLATAL